MADFRFWHPLRDPHHCSFRILVVIKSSLEASLTVQKLSVIDLLYLFPRYLFELRGYKSAVRNRLRNLQTAIELDEFVNLPDMRLVYRELQGYQRPALNGLVAKGVLARSRFEDGMVCLGKFELPEALAMRVDARITKDSSLLSFLHEEIAEMPLAGSDGLLRKIGISKGGVLR